MSGAGSDVITRGGSRAPRWGAAWLALTAAFALHVADEATHDFLSWYNPTVLGLRARLGFFPMPVFTFRVWLTGLIVAVVLFALLARFAFRGARWLVPVAYAYALIHLANGLGHITVSVLNGRLMPGVLSAPVLLAAAAWLLVETTRVRRLQGAEAARVGSAETKAPA